jgi:hypothetical protein
MIKPMEENTCDIKARRREQQTQSNERRGKSRRNDMLFLIIFVKSISLESKEEIYRYSNTEKGINRGRGLISTRICPRLFFMKAAIHRLENDYVRCRKKGDSFLCWRVLAKFHCCIAADQF